MYHVDLEFENFERAQTDLGYFCNQYLPQLFTEVSGAYVSIIRAEIQNSILGRRSMTRELGRGEGKSTLLTAAALWTMIYQHTDFLVFVLPSEWAATNRAQYFRTLVEGFGDGGFYLPLGFSFHKNECHLRHADGSRTYVMFKSIHSGVRGLTLGTERLRPDHVIVDDPYTQAIHKSPAMTAKVSYAVSNVLPRLGGAGQEIPVTMLRNFYSL